MSKRAARIINEVAIHLVFSGVPFFILLLFLAAQGCSSMGVHHESVLRQMDFGRPEEVKMCVYLDDGVSVQEAKELLRSWDDEGRKYDLSIKPVAFEHHERSGFFHWQIIADVNQIPLKPGCDRVIFFANRNLMDFTYGLAELAFGLPEVLGEVDDATLTHGYVYARRATPSQLLLSPSRVTRHELYHLMGCGKHWDMVSCYQHIQYLKQVSAVLNPETGTDGVGKESFFPTYANLSDSLLTDRTQVNAIYGGPARIASAGAQ